VHETAFSQPISVALQLCLVDLLKSWGITPSAVTSHSSGEIAAAYAVGVLSFQEALGVVYHRGRLAQKYQELSALAGGMLAAGLSADKAEGYLQTTTSGRVVVACINSPDSVTLSGDLPALEEVASRLEQDGFFARKLKVPLAYHSHHMLLMAQEYTESLWHILPTTRSWTGAVFSSPVSGGIITSPDILDPEHWTRNLTSPVLFAKALENMCFDGTSQSAPTPQVDILVEIGAHSTLSGPIRHTLQQRMIPYVSCLKRGVNAVDTMQDTARELVVRGYAVSLAAVNSSNSGQETGQFLHDLPSYPWNHTAEYWSEPRIYCEHRYKRFPPHELLGTPVSGGNQLTPTWRNFLRVAHVPWLADHRVDSKVVFPGASYVTMAIEAIRQLADSSESSISGYRLRDIDITNALTIPETSAGVETQLCLRPCSDKELDHKGWYEFELCSVGPDDTWIQNCKGYVAVETVHPNKRTERQTVSASSYWPAGEKAAPVDPESVFVSLRKMNFHHGPTLQNLLASQAAGSRSITTMALSTVVPGIDEQNYVIHPTTLDSIVQSFYVDFPAEMKERAQVVPRSIGSMFVARDLKRRAGDTLHAFTELIQADQRGTRSKAIVAHGLDESTGYLEINGFHFQAIPQDHGDDAGPEDKRLCSRMSWELDVLHNFPASLRDPLKIYLSEAEVDFEKRIRRASYYLISDAVAELEGQSQDGWQWHHKIFYNWMKEIVAQGKAGTLASGSASWSRATKGIKQRLYDQLSAEQAAGRLTCRVGLQLASIVRGEVTPLELMMEGNLLNEYYEVLPKLKERTYRQLKQVAELYAVKNPGANVLEIGAGTGGATTVILDAFGARSGAESGTLLGHYDFTDISSGFFGAARQKFAAWDGMIEFKKLDIETDPVDQSFETGKYDLIVASAVLHATKSLHRTMSHVCRLLKPGGTVLMIENTTDTLDMQLIFGTLPGWWLSEEPDRKMSPNVPLETWDSVFRATGFPGVDFEISDCEEPEFSSESIIMSTAKSLPAYPPSMSIIYSQAAPPQEWLNELAENIQTQCGYCPSVQSLETVEPQENCVYIALLDMERPILNDIDSTTLEQVKKLLSNSLGLLWLSSGSVIDAKKPLFALAQGMLRTLKQEDTDKRCIQLDFESTGCPWTADKIPHIMHVLHQSFDYRRIPTEIEWEYAVKDSLLHVPRHWPDRTWDEASNETHVDPAPEPQPFWQPGRALTWEPSRSGLLNEIYFTDAPALEGVIPRGMVEIEPKAFGLNFRDVMVALGQLDETLVGHECAGIVRGLGPGSHESGLKVGDRVCGIGEDRFGSTTRASWTSVARIPDEMAWEEAASIPCAFMTAYIGLFDIARLQKGQRVLIHAATGGVGQAALMLAQWAGAELFATCGTAAKRELLINHYHLAPDHIFSSRDPSFAAGVMAQTNGDGVDVILNSLAGPLLKASWECIARFGRFVEIGKVDLEASRRVDLSPLARSATLAGLDLLQYLRYQPQVVYHALQSCVQLCHAQQGVRAVHPITPYSMADMDQAMRSMQGGSHTGKLVLVPGAEDQVRVVTRPRPLRLDRSESTYLVVGGLGGVGRAIALWMIEQGARHVLVVSRNAASHPDAAQLIDDARADGCNLYIRDCDVADEAGFLKLLDDCADTMPPIRGVVQAAMVLDVSSPPIDSTCIYINRLLGHGAGTHHAQAMAARHSPQGGRHHEPAPPSALARLLHHALVHDRHHRPRLPS
jgi:NADPH:quinone reductase-like Zn-dependent oxidoreductase/ubiquinone/menaquinone biosynthesis C-methylase UbiE